MMNLNCQMVPVLCQDIKDYIEDIIKNKTLTTISLIYV